VNITVTDHALLRWLERVYGLDLDKVRDEIAEFARPAATMKAVNYAKDGVTIALNYDGRGAVVKTVLPNSSPSSGRVAARLARGKSAIRRDTSRKEHHQRIRRGYVSVY
jgi:hypothetical protein